MSHAVSKAPWSVVRSAWMHRLLIAEMCKREIHSRYKESVLGLLWSILNPILMLGVYTFIFGVVFQAKWNQKVDSHGQFALVLFCGLIIFNIFSEVIVRSPALILNNAVYVKKVVFPLEILPLIALGTSLFTALVSLLVLILFALVLSFPLSWTVVLLPVVALPLILLTLGLSWFLSSLGVYLRDIGQIIGVAMSVLLFMSPVFFPISAVPESFRVVLAFNPLAHVIEQSRQVVLWGAAPDWRLWTILTVIGFVVFSAGFVWFQKTRKGFADVI